MMHVDFYMSQRASCIVLWMHTLSFKHLKVFLKPINTGLSYFPRWRRMGGGTKMPSNRPASEPCRSVVANKLTKIGKRSTYNNEISLDNAAKIHHSSVVWCHKSKKLEIRDYMNTLARAILYDTSIDVTRGHKVARRTMLVMVVLYDGKSAIIRTVNMTFVACWDREKRDSHKHPMPNITITPSFGIMGRCSLHTTLTGININIKSLTVFVIAVARYTAGMLMQEPCVTEASQLFWMGLQAKMSAKVSAVLYPAMIKAMR